MNKSNVSILFIFLIVVVLAIFAGIGLLHVSGSSEETPWNIKFLFVGAVSIFLVFALLFNYERAKHYIPYILALYIANTGFTYAYQKGYYTSANEVLTLAILIIWVVKRIVAQGSLFGRPYFSNNVKIFLLLSVFGIVTAYFGFEVKLLNILTLFKSYTLYMFYLFLIPDCIDSERELYHLLIFIVIISLLPLYYAVTGSMEIESIYERLSVSEWGALNIFVGYILPVFFISFGLLLRRGMKWKRLLILPYMGCIIYVLFLSQTRTGWGALIACTGLFVFMTNKKMMAFAASIVLVIGMIYSPLGESAEKVVRERIIVQTLTNPDNSLRQRYSRWEAAWDTAKTYPFTGSGWGALLPVAWDGTVGNTSTQLLPFWHDAYLEVLSQLGIPGLLAFLLLWAKIMKTEGMNLYRFPGSKILTINVGLFIAVVACLIYALAEQQFYRIETASHTYFLAGLLLTSGKILKAQEAEKEEPDVG
jgi:O-antigen ligase